MKNLSVECISPLNNDQTARQELEHLAQSQVEIARVLSVGVSPDRIIFANPVKQQNHIRFAAKVGVDLMTFDNSAELYKIKEHNPNA
ncbi:unnamed protein product, partial [Nesidiocoris tenuis]